MSDRDDGRAAMQLPPGKLCSDCVHWRRCKSLIYTLCPVGTECDFAPSRFRERRDG